jgi:competence protein ComGF
MNGDPSTHIKYVNQILTTGKISTQLFYPALHIYTSQILLLLNINVVTLHKILPLFLGILYIPFIYLFSKSIFTDKNQIILSTVIGSTFANGWYLSFIPNGLSNLYFPLLLFIILKVNSIKDVRWEILALIMVFFYPIFHLIPTLVLIIFISTLSLVNFILHKMSNTNVDADKNREFSKFKLTLFILLVVCDITWISSFYLWDYAVKNFYTLITEGDSTQISYLVKNINYAQGYGYNVIEQALKTNGGPLLYVLVTVVSLPTVWKHKNNERLSNLLSLYGPLFFICLFIVIFYFSNVLFSPLRMVTYTTIICTPFLGFSLNDLISKIRAKPKRVYIFSFIGLICLLFIIWINGILTLYPSPYTLGTSYQTTVSEVEGTSWLFENKNVSLETTGITVAPFRFGEFLLTDEQRKLQNLHEKNPDYLKVPYHFGYDNNSQLSSYYNQSLYMGINERDKRIYVDVVPEIADIRWVPKDFEKLNDDVSLKKIYSSKKFEMFYINGSGKT